MDYKRLIDLADNPDTANILWRHSYFWCGHTSLPFYNFNFMIAMEIIGKKLNATGSNSDYHNGIAYIAKKARVSKTQVKAIRKKMKVFRHYEFKTSKKFDIILSEIITALEGCGASIRKEFVMPQKLYRDTLVYDQYSAIRVAADDSGDRVIHNIATKLEGMRKELGE